MLRVHKFPLEIDTDTVIKDRIIQVLNVKMQETIPVLWVLVSDEAPMCQKTFTIVPTGRDFKGPATYIGTFFEFVYVWHVFEVH